MSKPCEQCIKGTVHSGQPLGKIEKLHDLDVYIIGNRTNPRATIVMYPDVFGLALPNNRLIADAYAKSGEYLVYLVDFFKGDPVQLQFADVLIPTDAAKQSTFSKYTGMLTNLPSFVMWSTRHKAKNTDEDCVEFLTKLRKATPRDHKIGMVGYCWGGRYALRAAREDAQIDIDGTKVPLVDAAVGLHPSNLSLPVDVENMVVPVSYGWGKEDTFVKIETKGTVEQVHKKENDAGRKVPEMEHKIYTPGRHGFGVRGNPDDPQEKKCLEDSEKQTLEWFGRWL